MATKTWIGDNAGNEGKLNTAANWSPAGVPTAGDVVIFDGNGQAVTGDFTALASVALSKVYILESADYAFGDDSNFVELQADDGFILQSQKIKGGIHQAASSARLFQVHDAPRIEGRLKLSGKIDLSDAGVQRGYVTVVRDPKFATHSRATVVSDGMRIGRDGTVAIEENVTLGTATIDGKLLTEVTPGTVTVNGLMRTSGAAAIGTQTINTGGTVEHGGTGDVSLTTINGNGSFVRTIEDSYTFGSGGDTTIDGNSHLDVGPRATVSNDIKVRSAGKPLKIPAGATLTIAML